MIQEGKLGFLTTWNQECGLATYARDLLKGIAQENYCIFAEQCNPEKMTASDDKNVVRCWKKCNGDYGALYNAILVSGIKILHINCHTQRFFVFPEFNTFLDTVHELGIKIVVTIHSFFELDQKLDEFIAHADHLITLLPECRTYAIASGIPADKISVLYLGVPNNFADSEIKKSARESLAIPSDEKVIVSFGFIHPQKGMAEIIPAVALMRKHGINCKAYMVGRPTPGEKQAEEYLNYMRSQAERLNVADSIIFFDRYVDDSVALKWLYASDVVVMNYTTSWYEASGVANYALGAGAIIAASYAPSFSCFGDAVFHMSQGFSMEKSLELLLSNQPLREELSKRAREYADKYSWNNITRALLKIYECLGVKVSAAKAEYKVPTITTANRKLRILMQNRPTMYSHRGGDTILIEKLKAGLEKEGVEVVIDPTGTEDPTKFDLVHLYNFVLTDFLRARTEQLVKLGVPYVVTTLNEDVPNFHNQSILFSRFLTEYVKRGQDKAWFDANIPVCSQIQKAPAFDNHFVVDHAAALFSTGKGETKVLRGLYGEKPRIFEVPLGHEVARHTDKQLFIDKYGVKDFILCVGRLESRKNQLMLLKALEDSELPIVLVAGGVEYQPEYSAAVRAFKRKGQTLILDRLSDEMLASAYAAAKVHVLPSWYELPGLVSLEAGAAGCNVVAVSTGTTPDYLGSDAFYCSPDNADSIRNAVYAAYYCPVKNGFKDHCKSFTWENAARETLKAYQEILGVAAKVSTSADVQSESYESAAAEIESQELLESGEQALRDREYNKAHELLEKAAKLNPKSARILKTRGAVYLAENNIDEAVKYFKQATQLDESDARSWSGLGMCELRQGKFEDAYQDLTKSLSIDSDHLVTLSQYMSCCYSLNHYHELCSWLRQYVENHPDSTEMTFCYAGALYKDGQLQVALATVSQLLNENPEYKEAEQLRDTIETELQSTQETKILEYDDEAATMEVNDEYPNFLMELVKLDELKHQCEYDRVLEGVKEVCSSGNATASELEWAELLKGEVKILQGETKTAEEIFNDVLSRNARSVRAYNGKGALAISLARWREAREAFEEALSLDEKNDTALAGIGTCDNMLSNTDGAWHYFSRALSYNPENRRALLGVIELGYKYGKLDKVETALRNFLELHPGNLDFSYSLAGCYFAQNKLDEAWDEVNKITLFDPNHQHALELKEMIEKKVAGMC